MHIVRSAENTVHELPGIRFTALVSPKRGARSTSVWRVEIAPGTLPTPHQVTEEEVFVLLQGCARTVIGGVPGEAAAGDSIVVPKETDFQVENAGSEPLVAFVCFPVGGRARLADGRELTPPWAE
ncbi:MAG: cupin [Polyangiaceae bacterium]